jgi:hypothetical protein
MFVAVDIWQTSDVEECEKPLKWPVDPIPKVDNPYKGLWSQYSFAMNYDVCDLPEPDCICCKNEECIEATSIKRRW